ncbi:hypothetical protein [Photobacterium leiognathi]|uniref:hypothetical protein n=1 Tax=Photobacterium leiognathi TaxID=553611 RepID=UPI002732EAB6|nr:hypothetical protein [Photobacterium leiognathi]
MKVFIKNFIQKYSILFKFIRFVPFRFRLGKEYAVHRDLIVKYEKMSFADKELFHYEKLKELLFFAYNNNDFYHAFYKKNNYHPSQFKNISDFKAVPIVTKNDLKEYELSYRSRFSKSSMKVNTGGTSGNSLSFYLDKDAFAREWAYMHKIWSKLGYSYLDKKISFRGKSNSGQALKYNVVHNEYVVDAYVPLSKVVAEIKVLCNKKKIRYLHGYPSSIYEFCLYLKNNGICAQKLFNGNLKGVFLGSEYPAPIYRNVIEATLAVPTISWYGHSEMSVLAFEDENKFVYSTFPTYGFTESVSDHSGNRLICSSYYNFDSPFIRYDTGDLICNENYEGNILNSFSISSGRVGEFILDQHGNKISLTALIFGRHHEAFNHIKFIQVRQDKPGYATFLIASKNQISLDLFDLSNVDITFDIELVEEVYKTKAGKVSLLIK